jgi:uncharacterized membrane-anchored protein
VVAIGYYTLSLMGYAFDASKALGLPLNKEIASGIAMPIVLATIYFGMKRIRKHLTKQSKKSGDPLKEIMHERFDKAELDE